jgi:hypothetical protein
VNRGTLAREAFMRKTVFGFFEATTRPEYPSSRPSNHFAIRIRLEVHYTLPSEIEFTAFREAHGAVFDDVNRVVAALEQPGNLTTTEGGDATGLSSGALMFLDWSAGAFDVDNRSTDATFTFQGALNMTKPS